MFLSHRHDQASLLLLSHHSSVDFQCLCEDCQMLRSVNLAAIIVCDSLIETCFFTFKQRWTNSSFDALDSNNDGVIDRAEVCCKRLDRMFIDKIVCSTIVLFESSEIKHYHGAHVPASDT